MEADVLAGNSAVEKIIKKLFKIIDKVYINMLISFYECVKAEMGLFSCSIY